MHDAHGTNIFKDSRASCVNETHGSQHCWSFGNVSVIEALHDGYCIFLSALKALWQMDHKKNSLNGDTGSQ